MHKCSEGFTWDCTQTGLHPLSKDWIVVARGGFYSYHIHQGNTSDKKKNKKKVKFYEYKKIEYFFLIWVQFCVGAIPHLP